MDISTSTSPPIMDTIGCNTDFVQMKQFAALLREEDEIERLEAQVKEKEDEVSSLRKSLNVLQNRYEQLLKHNDVLTRDVRQTTNRLKELKGNKGVTKANERAIQCLYAIFQSFAETKFERLSAADCFRFLGFPKTATSQEIHKQNLRLQRLTHPDQNPTCRQNIATILTGINDMLTPKNRRILDCCGFRAVRNQKSHMCSFFCPFNHLDTFPV